MEVIDHLRASLIAAPALALIWNPGIDPAGFFLLTAAGVAAGVLVDLDHFPVYRLEEGDWRHVRNALGNPSETATDNTSALIWFEPWKKYVVHSISMPAIAGAAYVLLPSAFPVVAGNLALHLGMDLLHSYRMREFPFTAP